MLRIPFRLIANIFRLIAYLWSSLWFKLAQRFRSQRKLYVELELPAQLPLGNAPRGLSRWFGEDEQSLLELRETFARLQSSPEVQGVIVRTQGISMGPARVSELAQLFDGLREQGKHLVMHSDSASTRELPLLVAADDILLTPAGRLYLFGYRFDEVFAAGLLDRLGVQRQFIHIGAFKTATHRFHKQAMTLPQRLMMQGLHDGLMGSLIARIAARKQLTPAAVREAMAESPLDASEARALGLISGTAFATRIEGWLQEREDERALPEDSPLREASWGPLDIKAPRVLGQPIKPDELEHTKAQKKTLRAAFKKRQARRIKILKLEDYLDAKPELRLKPLVGAKQYVAMLDFSGAIVMDSEGGSPLGGGGVSIRASEANPVLERLRKDGRCVGVLIHINSPGGSALASDLIWHEIQRLRREKPVISFISDVGASGGYYLAAGSDRIICRPDTITGSIGVITGKIAIGRTLEKLYLSTESIYDDESALFTSVFEPLTERVMLNFRDDARAFYRRFLERVGQARGLERRRLHRYGRGRVYLGAEAKKRGLVDDLGGMEEAIRLIYELCEVSQARAPIRYVTHRKQSLRGAISRSIIRAPRLPDSAAQLAQPFLEPLQLAQWLEREPLLAILPIKLKDA